MPLSQQLRGLGIALLCSIPLLLGTTSRALAGNSSFFAGDSNSLQKMIIADTYIDPPSTASDKIARVGDIVTYRLTLNLSEGTTGNLTVLDVLPAGLTYVDLVGITPASGAGPFTYTVVSLPVADTTGGLQWNLGDVVNPPSGDGTPTDPLLIEYRAYVQPNFRIATPIAGLFNTATLAYLDAVGNPVIAPDRLADSERLTLVQPRMDPMVKLGDGVANTTANPLNINVATSTVQFHLESCNSGQAPAYGVLIRDDLASQFDETSLSVPVVAVGGTVLGAGDYSYTPPTIRGGQLIFNLNRPVGPDQCLTIDYSSAFYTDFGPNQLWNNTASMESYWSLPPATGQIYLPHTSVNFYMTNPAPPLPLTLQKGVDKSMARPGDRLQYTLTLQNPTTSLFTNLTLIDDLEALNATPGFLPGSISNIIVPAGASATVSGSTLTVTNLDIDPNSSQTLRFEAVLATNLVDGSVILNQAQLATLWSEPVYSDDPSLPGSADPTRTVIPANGIVFDSATHAPLAGVTLTLLRAATATPLPASCFSDPAQQNQVTPADGTYKFDLQFDPTTCPAGADYLIAVTAAPAGYLAEPSLIELPATSAATPPYPVPACPADAIPASVFCEANASATVPTGPPTYYLHLTFDATANQIYNNHIPVDPQLEEKLSILKTTPLINVSRGQIVPYRISVKNSIRSALAVLAVVDTLPPGFKYVNGSGRINGAELAPTVSGRQLRWDNLPLGYDQTTSIELLLMVGAGVTEGNYVNQAQGIDSTTGAALTEIATATVRVVPDPTLDCTDIIGKVFDDRDLDGHQSAGEPGLAGVRVVTARGLIASSDAHGRFHITCAAVPDQDRGSNFILKLDDRTLPSGYRLTTENPRVERATRGKMLRFEFGATIHRVVTLDIADGVYEPGSTTLRVQWRPKIDRLLEELQKSPAVLRLLYLADIESEGLVSKRLAALENQIADRWQKQAGGYRLDIETGVFWRRGGPP